MSLQNPYIINCPGCKNTITYYSRLSHYITCPGCNKFLQKNGQDWKILNGYKNYVKAAIDPVFEVGKNLVVSGKEYTITAIARYSGSSTEWNGTSEPDTTGYWPFIEFTLMDKQGRITHVYSDAEYSAEVIVTAEPPVYCIPEEKNGQPVFFAKDKKVRVIEKGNYDLEKFFGEFSCLPYKEAVHYSKLRRGNESYTVEWWRDDNALLVSFYSEKYIPASEFKKQLQKISAEKFYKLSLAENLFPFWGILTAVFIVLAFIAANIKNNGATRQTVDYNFNSELNSVTAELNPFVLEEEGAVYELKLNNSFSDRRDAEILVVTDIMDENHKIINSVEGEFSIESGYDDEGYWVEEEREGKKLFVLDKSGTYNIRVRVINTSKLNPDPGGVLSVLVQKTVLVRYYMIGALLCALLFFGTWQLKEHYEKIYLRKNGIWTREYITNFWIGAFVVIIFIFILI